MSTSTDQQLKDQVICILDALTESYKEPTTVELLRALINSPSMLGVMRNLPSDTVGLERPTGLEKSQLGNVLLRLAAFGLVRRTRKKGVGFTYHNTLTPAGKKVLGIMAQMEAL